MDIDRLSGFFCPDDKFRGYVVDILCGNLFTNNAKNNLLNIYKEMDNKIDNNGANLLYPMNAGLLNSCIDKQNINQNGNIYAGHDLPVWLGNPKKADTRIMVVSQDPRRSEKEMGQIGLNVNTGGIALSSPFGLHSSKWRSSKKTGLIHYLFTEMIDEYSKEGKTLSVYYTDVYKLRGVDAIVTDINNTKSLLSIKIC